MCRGHGGRGWRRREAWCSGRGEVLVPCSQACPSVSLCVHEFFLLKCRGARRRVCEAISRAGPAGGGDPVS